MNIEPETLESWIKFIRFHPDKAERYMDCFWDSQLTSKMHLLNVLVQKSYLGNVFIFGGWYGVLAQLINDDKDLRPTKIYSIDNDPECEWIINDVVNNTIIKPVTADLVSYEYPMRPSTVINTVTEHITQEQYDTWWNNIPKKTFYVLQGNNFWDSNDHIRCAHNLDEFKRINNCIHNLGEAQWACPGPNGDFLRFMVWGTK